MALPARRTRWDPFSGLESLHEEMSRLLTSAFPDVSRIRVNAWSPPVDVEETDDSYLIEADMPGVKPGDVDVEVQRNELRISGKVEEREPEGVVRHRRREGQFDYRLILPGEVDTANGCEADLDNGVLKLRLPKSAAAARRRIPVRGPGPEAVEAKKAS